MPIRVLACLLVAPALALSACGDSSKSVDTAAYTCADFNKSLKTKGDDTAGRFINDLRKQAALDAPEKSERRFVTLGIYFACRGKPGTTKPADSAVKAAKQMKAGTFKMPGGAAEDEKKSTK